MAQSLSTKYQARRRGFGSAEGSAGSMQESNHRQARFFAEMYSVSADPGEEAASAGGRTWTALPVLLVC